MANDLDPFVLCILQYRITGRRIYRYDTDRVNVLVNLILDNLDLLSRVCRHRALLICIDTVIVCKLLYAFFHADKPSVGRIFDNNSNGPVRWICCGFIDGIYGYRRAVRRSKRLKRTASGSSAAIRRRICFSRTFYPPLRLCRGTGRRITGASAAANHGYRHRCTQKHADYFSFHFLSSLI